MLACTAAGRRRERTGVTDGQSTIGPSAAGTPAAHTPAAHTPADSARPGRASLTAIGLAVAAALAGALLWGLAAMLLDRQFLLAALLIGVGAGYSVARYRPAHWPTIGAAAAVTVCGCALGTALAIVFVLLRRHGLDSVMANLDAVARIYPRAVGWLGLVFWIAAAALAACIPLRRRRGPRTQHGGSDPDS